MKIYKTIMAGFFSLFFVLKESRTYFLKEKVFSFFFLLVLLVVDFFSFVYFGQINMLLSLIYFLIISGCLVESVMTYKKSSRYMRKRLAFFKEFSPQIQDAFQNFEGVKNLKGDISLMKFDIINPVIFLFIVWVIRTVCIFLLPKYISSFIIYELAILCLFISYTLFVRIKRRFALGVLKM
ncbi:MAG: hypothetical protein PHO23_02720 [Candidatus Pacebacteria bacterium]|nr:hypothetical protein [Candidatus Paceibacterota bacterium]